MNDWSSFNHTLYYRQMTWLQSECDSKSSPDLPLFATRHPLHSIFVNGQRKIERTPIPFLAFGPNPSSMFFDKILAQ